MTTPIIADDASQLAAVANRHAIEAGLLAGGDVDLPPGEVTVDSAPVLTAAHSGGTLRGAGIGRTVLVNRYTPAPYFNNQSLCAVGSGIGYADGIAARQGPAVTLYAGTDMAPYAPGAACYGFKKDGFLAGGQFCTRRRVVAVAGNVVTLDGPLPGACDCLKPLDGVAIRDCREAEGVLACDPSAGAARFAPGDAVAVGSGPSVANEFFGEFRRVRGVDPAAGRVALDRPLRRGYASAALVRVRPVANVTLADLTLGAPVNPGAEPFACKFVAGWRVERVRCAGNFSLGCAWDCLLTDCEVAGQLGAAGSGHDITIRGGRYGTVAGEEGQHDVLLDGCRVGPWYLGPAGGPPSPNGVSALVACERWTLRGVRVEGVPNMPLVLAGRQNVLDGVTVAGGTASFLMGDGLRVAGLLSNRPCYLQGGADMGVSHSRGAPLVLGPGDPAAAGPSSGAAVDCGAAVRVPGSKWSVWP